MVVLLSLMVVIGMIGLVSASNSAGNGENHEGDTNPGNEHEGDNGEGQQGEDDDTPDAPASADTSSSGDGECHVKLQSPSNYNNTPHGEVIPALYTWQSATLECTAVTTEYCPAPDEFIGAVLCTPERISGEPQSNYWNTAKGQRTLRWLASARAALQDK